MTLKRELFGTLMRAQLCSTLEQRWSACRAPVYGEPPEPEDCADEYCRQWLGDWFGERPCTSPRRHQCRTGLSEHGYRVRAEWWLKLHDAGGSPEPMQSYDWCELPW